jgi:hypothetical protein
MCTGGGRVVPKQLHVADSNVAISHKVMRRMERVLASNQLIKYVTIGILIIGIASLLYGMVKGA